MKITKLTLSNFRSHESTELHLDRLNFILGQNGAGKSSIAMAIEWLLTNVCEVTDDGGKGAECLTRKGQAESAVTANFQKFWVDRHRTGSQGAVTVGLEGKPQLTSTMARDWMQKNLPPVQVLSAVLNASNFINLDPAAQKHLLSRVLADQGVPVPPELQDALASLIPIDGDTLTITQLDKLHKAAYERRTLLNRDKKQLADIVEPESMEAPSLETIKSKLGKLKTDRDAAQKEKYVATSGHESSIARRSEIEAEIAAVEALIIPMEEEWRLKSIAKLAEGPNAASETAASFRASIAAKEQQIKALVKLGSRAECPTCMRALAKKDITEVGQALAEQIKDFQKQLEAATKESAEYDKACQARERIKTSITAVGEKEQLERELAALPPAGAPPDTSELDSAIAEFDARIAKGQDVLVNASTLAQQIRTYKENIARREKVDGELAVIERVLTFAGPDGARKEAVGGKIEGFCDSINSVLEQFGFSANLVLEPFSLQVASANELGMKPLFLHQLSESEQFRFSIAFQIALAKVTGVGLVVIDRADLLDKEARRSLTSMLMKSGVEQAIVCSTSGDRLPDQAPPGVKFFQLAQENGVTRLVAESPEKAQVAA